MAKFKEAFNKLIQKEGGYVNHPKDNGGETYKGIARNFWPQLPLWKLIDPVVKTHGGIARLINQELEKDQVLQKHVENFYETHFWRPAGCHNITNYRIANLLFFQAVHTGLNGACRRLQESCNYLIGTTRSSNWEVLTVDGRIGPKSLTVINKIEDLNLSDVLIYEFRTMEIVRFKSICQGNPSQKVFYAGWIRRVNSK